MVCMEFPVAKNLIVTANLPPGGTGDLKFVVCHVFAGLTKLRRLSNCAGIMRKYLWKLLWSCSLISWTSAWYSPLFLRLFLTYLTQHILRLLVCLLEMNKSNSNKMCYWLRAAMTLLIAEDIWTRAHVHATCMQHACMTGVSWFLLRCAPFRLLNLCCIALHMQLESTLMHATTTVLWFTK